MCNNKCECCKKYNVFKWYVIIGIIIYFIIEELKK